MDETLSIDGVPEDFVARIVALHADYYARHWSFTDIFLARVRTQAREFVDRFDPRRDFVACVHSDGQFAGAITIDGFPVVNGFAHLRWFIVAERLRGQGWGNRLLAEALRFCAERHFAGVFLNTFAGLDPARHLYEKFGFALTHSEPGVSWGTPVTEQRYERVFTARA